jgi:hypothetical protein
MVQSGKIPVRAVEKVSELQREADVRKVSDKITSIEKRCSDDGFDSEVVEDIGGMLTLGVCYRSGISFEPERLGVSLLEEDRRGIELDMANRIRSRSTYLTRAAEEVLGPLESHEKTGALANWTTAARRLEGKGVSATEHRWLSEENGRQDGILMKGTGPGFASALSEPQRKNALQTFSKIRRAGNRIPILARLFKF